MAVENPRLALPRKDVGKWGAITNKFLRVAHNEDGTLKAIAFESLLGFSNVRDYGAVGDGVTDDTVAIQAAIDVVEVAGTGSVLFIPPGTFIADGLIIEGSMKIRGSGTLKHKAPATNSLLLCNDTNEDGCVVDIDGITFDGNRVARAAAAEAFVTTRAEVYVAMATVQLKINNCIFTGMFTRAIRFFGSLRLTNCRFEDGAAYDGTHTTHYVYGIPYLADQIKGSYVIIQGNSFVGADVTTPANYMNNPTGVFITKGRDDADADAFFESVVISGNTFEGCGCSSPAGNVTGAIDTYNGAEKIVISDNVIRKHSFAGIKAQAVDRCTITGNVISEGAVNAASLSPLLYGIIVEEKPRAGVTDERYDVVISNNVIDNAVYVGIYSKCDNSIVSNNIVKNVVQDALGIGILVIGKNHIIDGNVVLEYEQTGIQVGTGSSNIKVSNNLLNNTTYAGANTILFSGADKVTITGNHIQCNGGSAIRTLGLSDIILIEGNFIDAAAYGIDIREIDGGNTAIVIGQNRYTNIATMNVNDNTIDGLAMRVTGTLDNTGTPSVSGLEHWFTGGTTAITDFDNGVTGQIIIVIAEHSLTITDGTNIFLSGSANWAMTATDTLTLICKADGLWYEISRSDNGA